MVIPGHLLINLQLYQHHNFGMLAAAAFFENRMAPPAHTLHGQGEMQRAAWRSKSVPQIEEVNDEPKLRRKATVSSLLGQDVRNHHRRVAERMERFLCRTNILLDCPW